MNRILSIIFYAATAVITYVISINVDNKAVQYSAGAYGKGTEEQLRARALNKLCIAGIFAILFAVSALRYGIGNDYAQYVVTAHEAYVGGYVVTEPGFNFLVRLVYKLAGGECYEVIFALFAFVTLLIFLKVFYRDSADFSQSFFLFMTLGIYFQTFNTVRYYFALAMALLSMRHVLEKDHIRFVLCILAAALFHKSVLIVLPLYFIAAYEWKKQVFAIGVIAGAVCLAARGVILELALLLYPSYKDTVYLNTEISIVSVLRTAAVFLLYLWFVHYMGSGFDKDEDCKRIRFYGQLNFIAALAAAFFSFLPVVTRLVYYFSISGLLMLPLMAEKIADDAVRIRFKLIIAVGCAAYFALFLLSAHQDGVGLLPYRAWLFEERYLLK